MVPIANAPYSVGTVQMLHDRGVICLPGFVSNSGGVLASSLADLGLPQREVESLIAEYFRAAVVGILRVAARRQRPAVEIAESLARLHMLERVPSPTRSLATRVYRRFLEPRRPDRWKLASARREFVSRSRKLLGEITRMEQEA